MARFLRFVLLAALAVPGAPARAASDSGDADVMAHVRADRWPEAQAAASRYADPVVARMVTYFRLLAPGAATTAEIAAFMQASPDWPMQSGLARRRDEALAGEPNEAVVVKECLREAPRAAAALLHCAASLGQIGKTAEAATLTRHTWVSGGTDPAWEQSFLLEHGNVLTPADQSARFERLITLDPGRQPEAVRQQDEALLRQIARLPMAAVALAEARLALRRDDPAAPKLVAALGEKVRTNPEFFLDQAQALRRTGQDEAAVALWIKRGTAAEKAAAADRRGIFWAERQQMARRRLRDGDVAGAYALVAHHAQTAVEPAVDAEFLAGFIALRRMNDPGRALGHFRKLAAMSKAAITQGRADYWIGRAEEAAGHKEAATKAYTAGALWPNTYYGQLAALKLGDDTLAARTLAAHIVAAGDPPVDEARAFALAQRDLARAARVLADLGEFRRAQSFLLRLDEIAADPADRVLVANLATKLALPETAVALARRAGRDGVILLDSGWPQPVTPPIGPVPEAALVLGVIRQESSFDSTIISPVGARGLMQIMPATGAHTAKKLGLPASVPALVLDPQYNMKIGSTYLRELIDQFGAVVPLVVAAYNAGPARVLEWLRTHGDPRQGTIDMVDWIELIPFAETRNYVQRVIENQVIYRARRGEDRPHPLASWLQ